MFVFLVGIRFRKNGLCCCVLIINLWYQEVTGHACLNSEVIPRVRTKGGQGEPGVLEARGWRAVEGGAVRTLCGHVF